MLVFVRDALKNVFQKRSGFSVFSVPMASFYIAMESRFMEVPNSLFLTASKLHLTAKFILPASFPQINGYH